MPSENSPESLLADLDAALAKVDELDAPIVAAYLDSAITALCRQFRLTRDGSKTD